MEHHIPLLILVTSPTQDVWFDLSVMKHLAPATFPDLTDLHPRGVKLFNDLRLGRFFRNTMSVMTIPAAPSILRVRGRRRSSGK
jgi:hypothetical protein